MATSVVPELIDAIIDNARTTLGIEVYDGYGVTENSPYDYLLVGVDDVDSASKAFSADASQTWANANGTARDEDGDIVCAAVSWNGDGNQKSARDAAYTTVGGVENMLRANPSLGVANVLWTSFGTRVQLSQDQTSTGANAIVIFRIHFRARI